tara:strand:+ start:111 stop:488 length:378 start_codon:yes stop_codon:yes gene_type:complete
MKLIFSSISRLIFSYSKFLAGLLFITTIGTIANASDTKNTYLKCNDTYYRLNGNYLASNYNIRTKKFKNYWKVTDYKTNYIRIEYGSYIDRNTGEYKTSKGKLICILKVINPRDLPKLNDEGKLF